MLALLSSTKFKSNNFCSGTEMRHPNCVYVERQKSTLKAVSTSHSSFVRYYTDDSKLVLVWQQQQQNAREGRRVSECGWKKTFNNQPAA